MTDAQAAETRENLGAEPEKLIVTVEYDDQNDEYTADKTFAEIKAATEDGKTVQLISDDYEGELFSLMVITEFGALFWVYLFDSMAFRAFIISAEDTVMYIESGKLALAPIVWNTSSTTYTITPEDNHIYNCGTLTSLTVSDQPSSGAYSIIFTSGSTPTQTTIPATILGLEDFAAEANTMYEINVLDNRAVVGSWAVSA